MAGMTISREALLSLFPRDFPQLDVGVRGPTEGSEPKLDIFYMQRGLEDPTRRSHFPDRIYIDGDYIFSSAGLTDKDTLVLRATFEQVNPESIYLNYLVKHQGERFNELGRDFYKNFTQWAKSQGVRYVSLIPLNSECKSYWKEIGFADIREIRYDQFKNLQLPRGARMIHILNEGDRMTHLLNPFRELFPTHAHPSKEEQEEILKYAEV